MEILCKICFLYLFVVGLYQTNILGGCNCKRRRITNNQQNINQSGKNKDILNNIKSKNVLNNIFTNKTTESNISRYNKKTKERLELSIIDYMDANSFKNYLYNLEITFYNKGIDIEHIMKLIINILKGRYHVQRKDDINENNNNIIKDPLYKINGKSILIYEVKENNNTVTISLNSLIGVKIIKKENGEILIKNDWSEFKAIINALKKYET